MRTLILALSSGLIGIRAATESSSGMASLRLLENVVRADTRVVPPSIDGEFRPPRRAPGRAGSGNGEAAALQSSVWYCRPPTGVLRTGGRGTRAGSVRSRRVPDRPQPKQSPLHTLGTT